MPIVRKICIHNFSSMRCIWVKIWKMHLVVECSSNAVSPTNFVIGWYRVINDFLNKSMNCQHVVCWIIFVLVDFLQSSCHKRELDKYRYGFSNGFASMFHCRQSGCEVQNRVLLL